MAYSLTFRHLLQGLFLKVFLDNPICKNSNPSPHSPQSLSLTVCLCLSPYVILHIYSFLKKYLFICLHRVLFGIFNCDMWDVMHVLGLNLGPLHWKHKVLATGSPGRSLCLFFIYFLHLCPQDPEQCPAYSRLSINSEWICCEEPIHIQILEKVHFCLSTFSIKHTKLFHPLGHLHIPGVYVIHFENYCTIGVALHPWGV